MWLKRYYLFTCIICGGILNQHELILRFDGPLADIVRFKIYLVTYLILTVVVVVVK